MVTHSVFTTLLVVQTLNGLQLGVFLFIAAGLTLVFGVMDFINLAHGVQYMLGAYLAVALLRAHRQFSRRSCSRSGSALLSGCCSNSSCFGSSTARHLDHVIATFGIIFFLNAGVKYVWGAAPLRLPIPELFWGSVRLADGLLYPVWRLVDHRSGLAVAVLLYVLVAHTEIGMLVRAGATNPAMVSALGVDIRRLFTMVFGFGAMLAGFAGMMIAPICRSTPAWATGSDPCLRGDRHRRHRLDPRRLLAALLIGLVDTLGRSFAVDILRLVMGPRPPAPWGRRSPRC